MNNNLSIVQCIEALLLYQGGAVRVHELAKVLEKPVEAVEAALATLEGDLEGRGVRIVRDGDRVALTTATGAQEIIEKLRRDELEGAVGKAGLETLAIIIFRGPVSRSDIEYMRGVNASTMLRTLLIRGLIERVDNPHDKRSYLYRATAELPAYLGVTRLTDIPGYEVAKNEIEVILANQERAVQSAEQL
jgi:segregation and condensation protein B